MPAALRHCLLILLAVWCATAAAAETVGGAGLRTKASVEGKRADLRLGASIGALATLQQPPLHGSIDRFHLLGAHDKPSLGAARRGPAFGEAQSVQREREWAQLRGGADR